jgi:hypothetical protein
MAASDGRMRPVRAMSRSSSVHLPPACPPEWRPWPAGSLSSRVVKASAALPAAGAAWSPTNPSSRAGNAAVPLPAAAGSLPPAKPSTEAFARNSRASMEPGNVRAATRSAIAARRPNRAAAFSTSYFTPPRQESVFTLGSRQNFVSQYKPRSLLIDRIPCFLR